MGFGTPFAPPAVTSVNGETGDVIIAGSLPSQTGASGKYLTTNGTNASWATISGGGGTWGSITGTLSNQTDLQTVLNGLATNGANSNITSLTGLTTPLSVGQGGTGSATPNFVDLSSTQTISGSKTFSATLSTAGIHHSGTLQPTANNSIGLGTSSLYYSALYATTINLNSTASISGSTVGQITVTGKLALNVVSTAVASINLPNYGSSDPTSPVNGDIWYASNQLRAFVNGSSGNIMLSNNVQTVVNKTMGTFTMLDSGIGNIIFGTTTGTQIGTATTQKLAHWGATPIVQPTTSGSASTYVNNAGTGLTSTDTFDGYTVAQVVKALRTEGLLA